MTTSNAHSVRIAEIQADLAERKRQYFVDGIERPMAERAALEAELAQLKLAKMHINGKEKARAMQVRQLRGALLKMRLEEHGFAHLIDECNAEAEKQIPPITE